MKYKIGDKVKYDDGEWLLYGAVSAVYEYSVCPIYRVLVERKEKKNGRHSIVQFEFELEADHVVAENKKEKSIEEIKDRWNLIKPEQLSEPEQTVQPETKPEPKKRRSRKQEQEPKKVAHPREHPKETLKIKREKNGEAWNKNLEKYRNGEKGNAISTWMAHNRREFKAGKLSEEKFEKLMAVNFPFDIVKKKAFDNWDRHFEEWKKGDRRSKPAQQWRQRSIKQYLEGKLTLDKIAKLKEIGILK